MRSIFLAMLCYGAAARAEIITSWNFNSPEPDTDPATGTMAPSAGIGSATITGATLSFGTVAGGITSDENTTDNSQLRLRGFPDQGTGNKTGGVEFRASTEGFWNVRLIWDHENSASASRYWRIQYTLEGETWTDHETFANSTSGRWLLAREVSFSGIAGANNNPNFGVRIVSEFEHSTTGSGFAEYRAVGASSTYSTAGTLWLDAVRLEGDRSGTGGPPPDRSAIARWDFNSLIPDDDPSTGKLESSGIVPAAVLPIGTVSSAFGTVAGGETSDTAQTDNSMLRLGAFPRQSEHNKAAGVELRVSTAGRRSIEITWDQYNSGSASRYWRIQYTVNGTEFLDHTVFTNSAAGDWHRGVSASFAGVDGADDNPLFGIRLVAEFENTATGANADVYVAVNPTSNYSTAGTLWLDMITVSGELIPPPNTPPTISTIAAHLVRENTATAPLPFTVADLETPADQLVLTATSSNPSLVTDISFDGPGTNKTVTLRPNQNQTGEALITVRVADQEGLFAESTFSLVVFQANTSPTISTIPNQSLIEGSAPVRIPLVLADREQSANQLVTTVRTSGQEIVEVSIDRIDPAHELLLTPKPNQSGQATITVSVSDGFLSAETSFLVEILPLERPMLSARLDGSDLLLEWTVPANAFALESAPSPFGPWEEIETTARLPVTGPATFFRLRR